MIFFAKHTFCLQWHIEYAISHHLCLIISDTHRLHEERMLKYRILLLIGCIYHVTPVTSKSSAPSGVQILDGLCMARRTDRLLYRHRNDTHIYIAFDVLKTGTVDVFTWELLKCEAIICNHLTQFVPRVYAYIHLTVYIYAYWRGMNGWITLSLYVSFCLMSLLLL